MHIEQETPPPKTMIPLNACENQGTTVTTEPCNSQDQITLNVSLLCMSPLLQSVRLFFEPLSLTNTGADSLTVSTLPNLPTFSASKSQNSKELKYKKKRRKKKRNIYNHQKTYASNSSHDAAKTFVPFLFAAMLCRPRPCRANEKEKKILASRMSSREDANRREREKKNTNERKVVVIVRRQPVPSFCSSSAMLTRVAPACFLRE
ncbi:hypothetical protein LY76DRAFT_186445 [Colletotrichum caudatum]|nr:hypothetical protein LY76DRAFT_186445 [Colletotrichum caudatum]